MKKRVVDLGDRPSLDIVSFGRRGVASLSQPELELVARTARGVPEVMVKVTGGGQRMASVQRHLQYIDRQGKVEVETDVGHFHRPGYEKTLLTDWGLDIEEHPPAREFAGPGRKPKKLVHNLVFSMPPGTDPQKVLGAVRRLAKEEWMLKHRFALVLHTDEPHPHVHVVIKARDEKGKRLNIRKSTLRDWRQKFAQNLRELGVAANATERVVRGAPRGLPDTMYRAAERGDAIRWQRNAAQRPATLRNATVSGRPEERPPAAHQQVLDAWRRIYTGLVEQGDHNTALTVRVFLGHLRSQQEKGLEKSHARTQEGQQTEM